MIMDIRDTKEGAELIWQLNKVGDYNTHKELWDAYYNLERLIKNCPIPDVICSLNCKCDYILTAEQGHRVIKCLKCGHIKPI